MMTYLACFDISDDRIRRYVGKRLEHFGMRVQGSVFEVAFNTNNELSKLKLELRDWLEEEDDLRFYPLCKHCRKAARNVDDERVARFPAAVVV